MSHKRPSRLVLIRQRWRMVFAFTCLAFVLCLVVGRIERAELAEVAELPEWSPLVLLVGTAALFFFLSPGRFIAWLGLRHPFAYPPYWFGGALGVGAAAALIIEQFRTEFGIGDEAAVVLNALMIAAFSAPCAVLLFGAAHCARRKGSSSMQSAMPASAHVLAPSNERFRSWLLDDSAVATPAADLFHYSDIARRIAQRLVRAKPAAQALVGRLGSGKTTVRLLVEHWLSTQTEAAEIEIVPVELWPYESPRAAVEGVLKTVVEAFSNEVSAAQLEGLPAAYGEAIAKIARVSEWLPRVARRDVTPSETLQAFDDVATAIGRRYVLWVEDLERFAAGDPNSPAIDSELERLAPIRALLYGLDQLRSITVVTATTDLVRRFDLEKIARYIERIPDLTMQQVRGLISMMRDDMLSGDGIIDPADPAARGRLGWHDWRDVDQRLEVAWFGDRIGSFASAVASFATTPRTLKQGLRRAMETWEALRGEIDLDEVLALSMLQEALPAVFALLERSANSLRNSSRRVRRDGPPPMQAFTTELGNLNLEPRTRDAVQLIVDELFGNNAARRPQGVSHDHHANYLQRFLAVPELSTRSRDQNILKTIVAEDDEKLIDLLVDDRSAAVEDFVGLIPQRRLDGLIVKLVARDLRTDVAAWVENKPPGLIPLWRMLRSKPRSAVENEALASESIKAIELAAPHNLPLMYEVAHWLATSTPEIQELLPTELRERVVMQLREVFLETYINRAAELGEQVRGAPSFLLFWLCWFSQRPSRSEPTGVPFARWPELVPTLLEALRVSPATIATQIASFVIRAARRMTGPDEWLFDETQCRVLFGDVDEFVTRMVEATATLEVDHKTAAVLTRKTGPAPSDDDSYDPEGAEDQIEPSEIAEPPVAAAIISPHSSELPGQVYGYWFEGPTAIPMERPQSPPAAVLPGQRELGDASSGLLLWHHDGRWRPVSESDDDPIARALLNGQTRYFSTGDGVPLYVVSQAQAVSANDLSDGYDDIVHARVPADSRIVVVRFSRVEWTRRW